MVRVAQLIVVCCTRAAFAWGISVSTTHVVAADETRGLFRYQYHIADDSYCAAPVCVDFDDDGHRELLYASRATGELQMRRAADGGLIWRRKLEGDAQSLSAYDVDGDGSFEIVYTVSGPGRLYLLDRSGNVQAKWQSLDWKLGNAPVILDADGDGSLDALFGSRSKYLVRLNLADMTVAQARLGWVQCGCQTSAMDVDGDGRWDLFAGSGDDHRGKGVLHRYDPDSLQSAWEFRTDDNASSADAVLVDIDGDGNVEIIKSVDNYAGDDAHDAVFAFETDGTLIWKTEGFAGEDSPNVADLDGDGQVEVVGMTFGGEVYCLDAQGRVKWRRDLRPELGDEVHAYLAPVLCDLDGDRELEVLALTNGGYFSASNPPRHPQQAAPGILFALDANGERMGRFEVGGNRFWGNAFVCNLDDDPHMELVVSGSGGVDVVETAGLGPDVECFQRRRSYQRLNVVRWSYEDTYFIYRGTRHQVATRADNLVLARRGARFHDRGTFTTELLVLPPGGRFGAVTYNVQTPRGTSVRLNVLGRDGETIASRVASDTTLAVDQSVRLEFELSTEDPQATPVLESYSLQFSIP